MECFFMKVPRGSRDRLHLSLSLWDTLTIPSCPCEPDCDSLTKLLRLNWNRIDRILNINEVVFKEHSH